MVILAQFWVSRLPSQMGTGIPWCAAKAVTLEKVYNGIPSTFYLGNSDFRSKFGTHRDPVRCLSLFTHPQLSRVSYVSFLNCTSVIPKAVSV